ncbi:aminoglycoside phosphotransferase family protein [Saccharibacillus sacchari]|uniref:phosphotransferase n=1 Tax=Saccharibacillus sacchari TaxID=456493 RepID=UPI00056D4DF1|nr:aminoglycoside phosphotransferase family protein [Saccharibacillus sacchari]
MDEETLQGGNTNSVKRIGDRVHRNSGPWTPAVHTLLNTLHAQGIREVPMPVGFDAEGREIVTFLPGEVGNYPLPAWLWAPEIVDDAGKLLRRIHDASVSLIGEPLVWGMEPRDPIEVICHNDVAPYNMTFVDGRLSGLFDFDTASPGPRIWDLAYLAYRLAPLAEDTEDCGLALNERLERIDRLTAAYGKPFGRIEVLETMAERLNLLAIYTKKRAEETGNPDFSQHAAMYERDRERILTYR